ncbi:MAG: peptide deformylase [Nitrospinota bacterium]|nr:peptide deformylase [Nitrospinota bacterium]
MSILKVCRLGNPVLRLKSKEVSENEIRESEFQILIRNMVETMFEYIGVGLAGPQVHISSRIFVFRPEPDKEDSLRIVVNPIVEPIGNDVYEDWEGCLSIPDVQGRVTRFSRILLKGLNNEGKNFEEEFEGFAARICQHETDHLDGVVFLDRMDDLKTLTFGQEYHRFWAKREEPESED